jgi:glycosyltransferase involved in cell wall biosynthesis
MNQLRLLFISGDFPNPRQPTRGLFNGQLVHALAREHLVSVVAPVSGWTATKARLNGSAFCESSLMGNVEVHHPRFWYTPKLGRCWYGSFLWWSVRSRISRILEERQPDAVIGYWAHPDGEVAVRSARQAGVPAVVMVGGSDVLVLTKNRRRRQCIVDVLQQADAVVAVSRQLRHRLIELGVSADRVHVIYRGVDDRRFYPGDRQAARARLGITRRCPILLWVGRMVHVKGLDVLLDSCRGLIEQKIDFHLYLVGDGPQRPALEARCRRSRLTDRVSFVGTVGHDRLPAWYRAADLTVLPSRSEGIPNVLRESLACGTPLVASAVGGIPEFADPQSCLLVPAEDPGLLADGIRQMLAEPRPGGRPLAATFTWDDSASALVDVIKALITPRENFAVIRRDCAPVLHPIH